MPSSILPNKHSASDMTSAVQVPDSHPEQASDQEVVRSGVELAVPGILTIQPVCRDDIGAVEEGHQPIDLGEIELQIPVGVEDERVSRRGKPRSKRGAVTQVPGMVNDAQAEEVGG